MLAPGGGADSAVLVPWKLSSHRAVLGVQPPSVVLKASAFESSGGLHEDALHIWRLCWNWKGEFIFPVLANDDNRRFGGPSCQVAIAKAIGGQLSS